MSRSVNDNQVPSSSPSRLRRTTGITLNEDPGRTHPDNIPTQDRFRTSPRFASSTTDRESRSRGYPLHEFRSLLEAAQRIASSATFDTEGSRWREDDQPDPIIHLNRRRVGELPQRRVPLTRRYSGRPHVPGEDSGSEASMDDTEIDSATETGREQEDVNNLGSIPDLMQGVSETRASVWSPGRTGGTSEGLPRPRADHVRTRDRQQDEEGELLEQALARSREVRSRFEADNRRSSLSGNQRTRYSTTGPSPTRESFYDWAPEPSTTSDPASSIPWSRTRAASIRRWRPAERLQDYASNHARRDSGSATHVPQPPSSESATAPADLGQDTLTPRPPSANAGSHDDVVDRVERALQQYRIARRNLRSQNDGIVGRALSNPSAGQGATEHAPGNRQPPVRPGLSDVLGATPIAGESLDLLHDPDSSGSTSITSPTTDTRDIVNSPSTIRSTAAGREGRQDPLRQRIRDQVRERRRHVLQSWAQESTRESLARGPLFEATAASQNIRNQADPRRALEKIRIEESRAKSAELKQAKAALQYLARLREPDMDQVKAWKVAADLGLHNQSLEEDFKTNLPMSVTSLPYPSFSSWLEPGMTWTGIQDANDVGENPTRSGQETSLDNAMSREQRERVDLASRQYESFRSRMGSARDPLERTLLGGNSTDPLRTARNSVQVLEDAERSLSSMLERSEELLRENERQLRDNEEQLRQNRERLRDTDRRLTLLDEAVRQRAQQRALLAGTTRATPTNDSDWWNVKVTLHSVNEKQMTVSGTMTASHKLNQPGSSALNNSCSVDEQEDSVDTSMDSFFTGEIVDFMHHGLDTVPSLSQSKSPVGQSNPQYRRQQDEWRVGGPETDLNYWAGVGPFKHEVDHAIRTKEMQNNFSRTLEVDEKRADQRFAHEDETSMADHDSDTNVDDAEKPMSTSTLLDGSLSMPLSEDEKFAIRMDTMARLLSDTEWLNENIGANGWILMRWKERCFVAPGTDPNPDARRPWIPSQPRTNDASMSTFSEDANPWNVHDLIASDRLRRRRERDTRVWSTNAAERDELSNPGGPTAARMLTTERGAREPTWGLTISGFYYVALERKTGRIEALYYDCGSTPFQRLRMSPQTLYSVFRNQEKDASITTNEAASDDGSQKADFSGITGLKTNFNIVEFR